MGLYLKSGYLDFDFLKSTADHDQINFIIIIGARQVGKTYGCLKLLLSSGNPFILMRRTQAEIDFVNSGAVNPFRAINPLIMTKKETQYTGKAYTEEKDICLTLALSTVSKIRGFYAADYTDLVYDEFIPESHVMKIKNEGDAFLNAVVTISGNRELEGKKPLRVWLLANSNNINSPILEALSLQEKLESMIQKGQELSSMRDRGIMIVLPDSGEVLRKRKQNALYKAISGKSDFSKMAYENKFSYNDNENVCYIPIKGMSVVFSVTDLCTVYQRPEGSLYVASYRGTGKVYPKSERGKKLLLKEIPNIKLYYLKGRTYFESLSLKGNYLNFLV